MSTEPDQSHVGSQNASSPSTLEPATNTVATRGRWSWFLFLTGIAVVGLWFAVVGNGDPRSRVVHEPASIVPPVLFGGSSGQEMSSMGEVLQIAHDALAQIQNNVDDYTATLIKQETINGALTEPNEMAMKVMCKHRGGNQDHSQPMRVYLKFLAPSRIAGREVIWAEDLYDGKLVVHEAGLMGLLTVRLDPKGMLAMQGQRYPIDQIGITKLVQKLVERGEPDRNKTDIEVTIRRNVLIDAMKCDLIVVIRKKPSDDENDFSRAEICFDSERKLPLRYTAYGWGADSAKPPLIESYTYRDIRTNVGLTDADFDPENSEYQFP